MVIKAKVVRTTVFTFNLVDEEWYLLERLIQLGREKLNDTNDPADIFAFKLVHTVNNELAEVELRN